MVTQMAITVCFKGYSCDLSEHIAVHTVATSAFISSLLIHPNRDHFKQYVMLLGIPCAGGSDAPVEPPLPLLGIYDAIFRQEVSRSPDNRKVFR